MRLMYHKAFRVSPFSPLKLSFLPECYADSRSSHSCSCRPNHLYMVCFVPAGHIGEFITMIVGPGYCARLRFVVA